VHAMTMGANLEEEVEQLMRRNYQWTALHRAKSNKAIVEAYNRKEPNEASHKSSQSKSQKFKTCWQTMCIDKDPLHFYSIDRLMDGVYCHPRDYGFREESKMRQEAIGENSAVKKQIHHSRKRKFVVATLLKKERKSSERTIIKKELLSKERHCKIIRMRTTTKSMRISCAMRTSFGSFLLSRRMYMIVLV
jgi:hypothetical protein